MPLFLLPHYLPIHLREPGNLKTDPSLLVSGPAGDVGGILPRLKRILNRSSSNGVKPAVKERVAAIRQFDDGGDHDPDNNYLFGEVEPVALVMAN